MSPELIKSKIEEYSIVAYSGGFRDHLGASLIGNECNRYIFYSFRWMFKPVFSGRMLRLFQRGHDEEPRVAGLLRGIGAEVSLDNPQTGIQWMYRDDTGHFGGAIDGKVRLPLERDYKILEIKTHKGGSGFENLKKNGVKKEKPIHYSQMTINASYLNAKESIYISINKSNDDIHIETIKSDNLHAASLKKKIFDIIHAEKYPERFKNSETFYKCKMCDAYDLCHDKKIPEKNCRSCVSCSTTIEAKWYCSLHKSVIPNDFLRAGCDKWTVI
jgi:hypothetical protein